MGKSRKFSKLQKKILEVIAKEGPQTNQTLHTKFDVSEQTISRSIKKLRKSHLRTIPKKSNNGSKCKLEYFLNQEGAQYMLIQQERGLKDFWHIVFTFNDSDNGYTFVTSDVTTKNPINIHEIFQKYEQCILRYSRRFVLSSTINANYIQWVYDEYDFKVNTTDRNILEMCKNGPVSLEKINKKLPSNFTVQNFPHLRSMIIIDEDENVCKLNILGILIIMKLMIEEHKQDSKIQLDFLNEIKCNYGHLIPLIFDHWSFIREKIKDNHLLFNAFCSLVENTHDTGFMTYDVSTILNLQEKTTNSNFTKLLEEFEAGKQYWKNNIKKMHLQNELLKEITELDILTNDLFSIPQKLKRGTIFEGKTESEIQNENIANVIAFRFYTVLLNMFYKENNNGWKLFFWKNIELKKWYSEWIDEILKIHEQEFQKINTLKKALN